MASDAFIGRQGVNYLTKLDLQDLIAATLEGYVEGAIRFAQDPDRIAH